MDIGLAPHQHQWSAGPMVDSTHQEVGAVQSIIRVIISNICDKERDLARDGCTYNCVGP